MAGDRLAQGCAPRIRIVHNLRQIARDHLPENVGRSKGIEIGTEIEQVCNLTAEARRERPNIASMCKVCHN